MRLTPIILFLGELFIVFEKEILSLRDNFFLYKLFLPFSSISLYKSFILFFSDNI